MANRRMFSQRIVGDENFLEMPQSTQNLYFHLGIYADDDGFVNPKKIIRMICANSDDLKVLISKNFVIPFESGVIVITNWKENNYIQADRRTPTIYQEELKKLECSNDKYCLGNQKIELEKKNKKEKPNWLLNRQKTMSESDLPSSFSYKIRNAFVGKECPVCKNIMEVTATSKNFRPSIQHNKPLIKGGKHELGNISVVCYKCNLSLRDNETQSLNSEEVSLIWNEIVTTVSSLDRQGRVGEVRLVKGSTGKAKIAEIDSASSNNVLVVEQVNDNQLVPELVGSEVETPSIRKEVSGSEINALLSIFGKYIPHFKYSNPWIRKSANTLILDHGLEGAIGIAEYYFQNREDHENGIPLITTPTELLNKMENLKAYKGRKESNFKKDSGMKIIEC